MLNLNIIFVMYSYIYTFVTSKLSYSMKTVSSDYIKEIKAQIKLINAALNEIQEAEKVLCSAVNTRDYNKAKNQAKDASADIMISLEEAVRLASAIGCTTELYEIHKYHKIIELDLRDSHK